MKTLKLLLRFDKGMLFVFISFIVSVFFISWIIYAYEKKQILKDIETRLIQASQTTKMLLKDNFFKEFKNKEDLTKQEELKVVDTVTEIVELLEISYIYALMKTSDGQVRYIFSSSNHKNKTKQILKGHHYFDPYPNATKLLHHMFTSDKTSYEERLDNRGHFRSIFISLKLSEDAQSFVLAADIDVKVLDELFASKLKNVFFTAVIILSFFILLSRRSVRVNLQKVSEIHQINQVLTDLNATLEERIEEALAEQKEHLNVIDAQSRHAQMGELISMIAHQWRQPLARISMNMTKLKFYHELGRLDDNHINDISRKVEDLSTYLSQTIDDFRTFLDHAQEKEEITYDQIIQRSLSLVSAFSDDGIAIKVDIDTPHTHYIHANNMVQVIINILNNAREALLQMDIEMPKITISATEDKDATCTIRIEDNAGGISEEIIDKIFDPYFSTKQQEHGTGLGMYMSRKIVQEQLDGSIKVENSGSGALFTIIIKDEEKSDV